jgi:hypothetical protein
LQPAWSLRVGGNHVDADVLPVAPSIKDQGTESAALRNADGHFHRLMHSAGVNPAEFLASIAQDRRMRKRGGKRGRTARARTGSGEAGPAGTQQ